jgi:hypothetical protein
MRDVSAVLIAVNDDAGGVDIRRIGQVSANDGCEEVAVVFMWAVLLGPGCEVAAIMSRSAL